MKSDKLNKEEKEAYDINRYIIREKLAIEEIESGVLPNNYSNLEGCKEKLKNYQVKLNSLLEEYPYLKDYKWTKKLK